MAELPRQWLITDRTMQGVEGEVAQRVALIAGGTMQNSELLARRSAMATILTALADPLTHCSVYHSASVFIRVFLLPCPSNRHTIWDNAGPTLFIGSPSYRAAVLHEKQ